MNPERWQELQRLFEAALQLAESEREGFLRRECSDETLVQEVLRMIAARPTSDFLEPPSVDAPDSGRQLGDFTLIEEIGRGGMGVVYKARQGSLRRVVAVKVLPANLTLSQRQIDRFQREARAAARLHHSGIVSILVVGEDKGTHYFAMEYVHGRNLAEEILRLRSDLGTNEQDRANLPSKHASDYFRTVAEIARQAADAIQYAHENGIVHRDVKPSNLLLDPKRHVKIVDFGLARDEEQGTLSNTLEGAGTAHYMSPEQARARSRPVDHRTDVYSLGVVLFELLTLVRPFEGTTSREVIEGILERDAPRIRSLNPRVPRDLETICCTAMAKDPKHRFRDAAAFRDDLARFLANEPIHARPETLLEHWGRRARRRSDVLVPAASALLAIPLVLFVANRVKQGSRGTDLRASIAARQGSVASLSVPEVLDLRRSLDEFRRLDGEVLAADPTDPLVSVERELAALRDNLRRRVEEELALARPLTSGGEREMRHLSAVQALEKAKLLFPEDEELQRLDLRSLPTISVRALDADGSDIPAEVYVRPVDLYTSGLGDRILLGPTPLPATRLEPGYSRVIVVFSSGGVRELICDPGPESMQIELTARYRADEEAITAGMVLVPGGRFTHPEYDGERLYQGKTIALDSFWIDATEVSNAEYDTFVRATRHRLPRHWSEQTDLEDFLRRYGDRPVVGVSWSDAVAFAEWRGKRLPTVAERDRVAGGPEGWPFPYSPDTKAPPLGNVLAPNSSELSEWDTYLARAVPVLSMPEAATPDGVYHLFGNVFEYTESMAVTGTGDDGHLEPRHHDRFIVGGYWAAVASRISPWALGYEGTGPDDIESYLGFRCAKSASP